jgi:hypothetical protein
MGESRREPADYTEAGRNRLRRSPAREPMERLARDLKRLASTNEGSAHCQ